MSKQNGEPASKNEEISEQAFFVLDCYGITHVEWMPPCATITAKTYGELLKVLRKKLKTIDQDCCRKVYCWCRTTHGNRCSGSNRPSHLERSDRLALSTWIVYRISIQDKGKENEYEHRWLHDCHVAIKKKCIVLESNYIKTSSICRKKKRK